MSKEYILKAMVREATGSGEVGRLRRQGIIPGVLYGSKNDPANLQFLRNEVETLLNHAIGENLLIKLEVKESGSSTALIQEIQHHPVSGDILHLDLLAVSMDEEITTEVMVEPAGDAIGVKTQGGLLEQNMRQIEVSCLPSDLPEVIRADVSELAVGDSIHIGDIKLPEGVVATQDPQLSVFQVLAPRVETAAEDESEQQPTEPVAIKEKKETSEE